jgi:hypothetical protein
LQTLISEMWSETWVTWVWRPWLTRREKAGLGLWKYVQIAEKMNPENLKKELFRTHLMLFWFCCHIAICRYAIPLEPKWWRSISSARCKRSTGTVRDVFVNPRPLGSSVPSGYRTR